jgi:manganese-dependent inorganic pyrophosphatase
MDAYGCWGLDAAAKKTTANAEILITDKSDSHLQAALAGAAPLVLACGPGKVGEKWRARAVQLASTRELTLLSTSKTPLQARVGLHLAQPIGPLLDRDHPTFNGRDLVRDVHAEVARYNYGGFIIIDDDERISGVVARDTFLTENRFRVILVDHNEPSQSVDGINDAEVIEVVDHHRLGARSTDAPIAFTNRIVGSTATIVAEQYRASGWLPSPKIAGLMLAAILSDTVILRSPTTTKIDREMARWMAELCGEQIRPFGEAMFAAGSSLRDLSDQEILQRDRKELSEGQTTFAISQVEVLGFKEVLARLDDLMAALQNASDADGTAFSCLVATDITAETSLLLLQGDERIRDAITYPRSAAGVFEMKDVLSRKKQVLPYFLDLIRRV